MNFPNTRGWYQINFQNPLDKINVSLQAGNNQLISVFEEVKRILGDAKINAVDFENYLKKYVP